MKIASNFNLFASNFNLFAFVSIFAILTACGGRKYESPRGLGGLIIGETTSAEAMALIEPGTISEYNFQRGRWGTAIDSKRKALQASGYTQYYTSYKVQFAELEVYSVEVLFHRDTVIAVSLEPGGILDKEVATHMREKYGPGSRYTNAAYNIDFIHWANNDIELYRYPKEFPASDRYQIQSASALKEYEALVDKIEGRDKERAQKVKSL